MISIYVFFNIMISSGEDFVLVGLPRTVLGAVDQPAMRRLQLGALLVAMTTLTRFFEKDCYFMLHIRTVELVMHKDKREFVSCWVFVQLPVQILGVSPIEGFDMVKAAYTRRRKDAEKRGDEAYVAQVIDCFSVF